MIYSYNQSVVCNRICSNLLQGIESDFAYTKVSRVVSKYILRSGSLRHPLSSSMPKDEQIFSLVITFSVLLYNLVSEQSYQLMHYQKIIREV